MTYMVHVRMWFNKGTLWEDYSDVEYSGTVHYTHASAEAELKTALNQGYDAYIVKEDLS